MAVNLVEKKELYEQEVRSCVQCSFGLNGDRKVILNPSGIRRRCADVERVSFTNGEIDKTTVRIRSTQANGGPITNDSARTELISACPLYSPRLAKVLEERSNKGLPKM